jgi:PKD repeat protein
LFAALMLFATARGAEVDFDCSPAEEGQIVGLPPLEMRCVADLPLEGTYDELVWSTGDGTLATGETSFRYTYEEGGQYTVALTLEGYRAPEPTGTVDTGLGVSLDPIDLTERKYGYVTVCTPPEPRFTYIFKGGLDYQMVNQTQPQVNCIDAVQWTVHEGDSADGKVLIGPTLGWEPRFTVPDDGTYTVVLSVGGLAGTRSAKLTVDAKYGLTEEIDDIRATSCATAPGGAAGALWVGAVLLGLRRRR